MKKTLYGISPSQEAYIPLPSGCFFVFPSFTDMEGADYVRIVAPDGGEVAFWSSDEWATFPLSVMGAICRVMLANNWQEILKNRGPNAYYQFANDCLFPKGVKYNKIKD
jgi:hypothetical protein